MAKQVAAVIICHTLQIKKLKHRHIKWLWSRLGLWYAVITRKLEACFWSNLIENEVVGHKESAEAKSTERTLTSKQPGNQYVFIEHTVSIRYPLHKLDNFGLPMTEP